MQGRRVFRIGEEALEFWIFAKRVPVGFGPKHATAPSVSVASSPFTPEVALEVSKVRVRLKVVLGPTYQLKSSKDLNAWTAAGASFVARDELLVQEFDVDSTGRYFRIRALP